jgi:hypothetical protein
LGEEEREQLKKIDKVDHAIDNFSDEKIGGQKFFTQTVIAEGYKLHDGTSLKPVAVETIKNNRASGVLIANGDKTITAAANLAWDGHTLTGENLKFNNIYGSAENLTDLPAENLRGLVPAKSLDLRKDSALAIEDDQLTLSFHTVGSIKMNGQALADADSILVYDNSHNLIRKSTLQAFYKDYINSKIHHPAGEQHTLQFKKGSSFGSAPTLTFDSGQNLLNVQGQVSTLTLKASEQVQLEGPVLHSSAQYQNITTVSDETYEIGPDDYTLLADISTTPVCITLPDASASRGRLLNIKAIHTQKYTLKSNILTIKSDGGLIDLFKDIKLKMNSSSRCLQSDGENWWIINSRGP